MHPLPTDLASICIYMLPPTLAALGTLVKSFHNAREVAEVKGKTDTLITKTAEIHDLTDGNLSAVRADLAKAQTRIEYMQSVLDQLISRTLKEPAPNPLAANPLITNPPISAIVKPEAN